MLYEIYDRVICDLGWKGPLEVQLPPLIKDRLFQVAQGPVQSSPEHLQVWRLQVGQLISEFHRENFFFFWGGEGSGCWWRWWFMSPVCTWNYHFVHFSLSYHYVPPRKNLALNLASNCMRYLHF